jgi:hypothetical protein
MKEVTPDFPLDIPAGKGKDLFVSLARCKLAAEFSGTWPGKRGTQFFGANPPSGGRASNLLPEPCS